MTISVNKKAPHMQARASARLAAVQALYQMEQTGIGIESVILEFSAHRLNGDVDGALLHEADDGFFAEIVRGVVDGQARIDRFLSRHLAKNWKIERLDSIARAVLRAALFELTVRPDVPFRVVIDEYMDVADAFMSQDDARFINAVLDAAAAEARPDERGGLQAGGA